jgi:glycosyltransferase involved in cell wall biosynthesis
MAKILCLDSYSGIGGGQKVMFDIISGLKQDHTFVVASPLGIYSRKYMNIGLRYLELKSRWPVTDVRQIIKEESPDVLHMNGTRAAFWGRIAVIGLKKRPKTVYVLHGFHIIRRKGPVRYALVCAERLLNRWTDVLVCVSGSDKELVEKNRTINKPKIIVIRNGIDTSVYRMDLKEVKSARESMGLGSALVISTVGRLDYPKDYSTILKAMRILKGKDLSLKLLVIGDGPLRASLEQEAGRLELEADVSFVGFRDDVPLLMNVSDIVVLSSRWEGLPGVCLEAGAAGKPMVASDVAGVRDVVLDNKTGYLFAFGSADDLAAKIEKLASSASLMADMGRAGYEYVSANYDRNRMIEGYRSLYTTP